MVLQQTSVLACNVQCEGGSPPRAVFAPTPPPQGRGEGSLKTRHPYLRFLCYFLFKSSSPLCEKPGLAFRDHHGLAQTRKLCLRFLCYLLFKSSFLPSVRNQDWPSGITLARTNSQIMPSFPLLPSVQVLFSPSVRNQDWSSGITTGSHKLANYTFVFLCYLLFKFSFPLL